MALLIYCSNPQCQQALSCPAEFVGKQVQCPKCGMLTLVAALNVDGFAPGTRLGNYTLARKIGEGGMGSVYEAMQEGLNRRVALKVLRGRFTDDPNYLKRFQREAQSAASLNHRNIVSVYEIAQDQGYSFFSMEFVDGETLQDRLSQQKKLSVKEGLSYLVQAARALAHAWEHTIIHRDIKPNNLILTKNGTLKITDLGLAKAIQTSGEKTSMVLGAPSYMSPEQAKNLEGVDIRADIYSLGATFYHAFTGQVPFVLNTVAEVMSQLPEAPLRPVRDVNPDVPPLVAEVIEKMLAKEPEHRYQSPKELLIDLDQVRTILFPSAGDRKTGPFETIQFRASPGAAEDLEASSAEREMEKGAPGTTALSPGPSSEKSSPQVPAEAPADSIRVSRKIVILAVVGLTTLLLFLVFLLTAQ